MCVAHPSLQSDLLRLGLAAFTDGQGHKSVTLSISTQPISDFLNFDLENAGL